MYHCDVGGGGGGDDHHHDDGDGGGEEVFVLHAFHLLEPCALTRYVYSFATFRFFMIQISQQYNRQMLCMEWNGMCASVDFFFQALSDDAFLILVSIFYYYQTLRRWIWMWPVSV